MKQPRGLTVRAKITLWFALALTLIMLVTCLLILFISNRVLQKAVRDSLIETVESSMNEVEYYAAPEDLEQKDVEYYLPYGTGYVEIDRGFLNRGNEVYTALYREDGTLVYGENPVAPETDALPFIDFRIRTAAVRDVRYYIFDRKFNRAGLEGLWMRGIVAETQGANQFQNITRLAFVVLPLLGIAAVVGAYLLAGRMMRPVQALSDTVSKICDEDDLKKRIETRGGRDEIDRLAENFNGMIERLDRAFETERNFTADASHELRTPVSVILAQCEYTLEETRSPEEYREALGVISRQGRKMSRLIGTMLEFTRLETGAERYPRTETDLTELTRSVCGDMARIGENGIALSCEAADGIAVSGNRELLARVLTNLIGNAYRYSSPNGSIRVRLTREADMAVLSVADNGIGIPPEEQEKIFLRFYRGDRARSTEGTGMGLSMVQEIVRFHGGTVSVESEPGQGSIFTVRIPLMFL